MADFVAGRYLIKSAKTGNPVGRYPIEDFSLRPKRVLSLQNENENGFNPHGPWELERLGNSRYILKASGKLTGVVDGKVYALLLEVEKHAEWVLEKAGTAGRVKISLDDKYWTVPPQSENNDENQIRLEHAHDNEEDQEFIIIPAYN